MPEYAPRGDEVTSLDVDVTELGIAGVHRLAVQVFVPAGPTGPTLLCVPGGGMSRGYFDLDVPSYSFAAAMLQRGHAVVLVDPPGVGDSDKPADLWSLTPAQVAAGVIVAARATTVLLGQSGIADAHRTLVGVGHSMGASIVIRAQAQSGTFDGLALFGWSDVGLPAIVDPSYRCLPEDLDDEWLLEGARASQAWQSVPLPSNSVERAPLVRTPDAVKAALRSVRSPLLPVVAFASYAPGCTEAACSRVEVPVLVCAGEFDLAKEADRAARSFPAATVDTLVLPGAGHDQIVSEKRDQLFEALHDWSTALPDQSTSQRSPLGG